MQELNQEPKILGENQHHQIQSVISLRGRAIQNIQFDTVNYGDSRNNRHFWNGLKMTPHKNAQAYYINTQDVLSRHSINIS